LIELRLLLAEKAMIFMAGFLSGYIGDLDIGIHPNSPVMNLSVMATSKADLDRS